MPDFDALQKLLDEAERNLQEVQMLTDQIVMELKASPLTEGRSTRSSSWCCAGDVLGLPSASWMLRLASWAST